MKSPKPRGRTSPAAGVTIVWWSARRARRPVRVFQPEEERPKRSTCSSMQRRSSSTRWDHVQSNGTTPLMDVPLELFKPSISCTGLIYLPAISQRSFFLLFAASGHQVPLLGPGGGGLLPERQVVVRWRPHEAVQDCDADTSRQDACHHGQTEGEPDCVNFQINTRLLHARTHTHTRRHTEDRRVHKHYLLLDSRKLIIIWNQFITLFFLNIAVYINWLNWQSISSITWTWTEITLSDHDGNSGDHGDESTGKSSVRQLHLIPPRKFARNKSTVYIQTDNIKGFPIMN